jgi:hypothetical protein
VLLPQGQVLHKDLSTSFTNFEQLFFELRQNRFNGYIRLNFWGYDGILILDVGRIIQGYSQEQGNYLWGAAAVGQIMDKALDKDGTIDIHSLSNEMAITLASVLGANLFESYPVVNGEELQKMFKNFEEKSFTGYVDLMFHSQKSLGTIFFLEGIPVEAVIKIHTGKIISGEQVFQKLLEYSRQLHSEVKAYRNQNIDLIQEDRIFFMADSPSPGLEYWNRLFNVLSDEISPILKKVTFPEIWQTAIPEIAPKFHFLDPISGSVSRKGNAFYIDGILLISDFSEGILEGLRLTIHKIPLRRRKKIKISRIVDHFLEAISDLDIQYQNPDPLEIMKKIFQGDM